MYPLLSFENFPSMHVHVQKYKTTKCKRRKKQPCHRQQFYLVLHWPITEAYLHAIWLLMHMHSLLHVTHSMNSCDLLASIGFHFFFAFLLSFFKIFSALFRIILIAKIVESYSSDTLHHRVWVLIFCMLFCMDLPQFFCRCSARKRNKFWWN